MLFFMQNFLPHRYKLIMLRNVYIDNTLDRRGRGSAFDPQQFLQTLFPNIFL